VIRYRAKGRSVTKAVTAVMVFGLVAAACGGNSGGGNSANGGSTVTTANETNLKPQYGGDATFALEADTTGGYCLSEAQLAIAGIQVARAVYDTLTVPASNGTYVPFLAQSVTSNPGFTQWTINLRSGIKFSDGTPLNAADVRDNLNNYRGTADPGDPKPLVTGTLFPFVFASITSVKATGPMTVTVTMSKPWASFPASLYSYGRLGMMGEAQMHDPKKCYINLVGTGPFQFKGDWVPNNHMTVVKNPTYWRKDKDGNRLPYLDKITFQTVLETSTLIGNLESKVTDLADTDNDIAIPKFIADTKSGKLSLLESDTDTEIAYTLLNEKTEPFNHYSARAAFAYAVNRVEYNKLRQGGLLKLASGPFAPGVIGNLPATGPNGTNLPDYDLAKAKQYAAQYKQETGHTLSFQYGTTNDADSLTSAELIKSYLQAAGMSVSIRQADQSQFINDAIQGNFQAQAWRNHPGFDPDTQTIWWTCGVPAPNPQPAVFPAANKCDNPVNFSGFNDAVINNDMAEARTTTDVAKRTQLYQDVNKEFARQLWELWGYYVLWTVPSQTNVHGINNLALPTATSVNATGELPFLGLASGIDPAPIWMSK
jgi:peptide/nickel transport system substrate-binding protein